jgi:hypothetical protein
MLMASDGRVIAEVMDIGGDAYVDYELLGEFTMRGSLLSGSLSPLLVMFIAHVFV